MDELVRYWETKLGRPMSRGEMIDMLCDNMAVKTQDEYDAIVRFVDGRAK
jgi:hypothetical protein